MCALVKSGHRDGTLCRRSRPLTLKLGERLLALKSSKMLCIVQAYEVLDQHTVELAVDIARSRVQRVYTL